MLFRSSSQPYDETEFTTLIDELTQESRALENLIGIEIRQINKTLGIDILADLLKDTEKHCSYCDFAPLRGNFEKSIDHFKPKSDERFYLDVCKWENLYIACVFCQGVKKERYNDLLLRPDEIGYRFYRYFSYDVETHEIEVNAHCQGEDKLRAITTIMIFEMNHPDQTDSRRVSYLHYTNALDGITEPDIQLYSHRFIFE